MSYSVLFICLTLFASLFYRIANFYGEKQLNEFINSKSYFYRNELLNKKELSVSMPLD
jgi:hypothetical protein